MSRHADPSASRWRLRLLAISLLPALSMVIVLEWIFLARYRHDLEAALSERGKSLARQIEQAAEYAIFINDVTMLKRLTDAVVISDEDVTAVRIYDPAGALLAQSGEGVAVDFVAAEGERVIGQEQGLLILWPIRRQPASIETDPWNGGSVVAARPLGSIRIDISYRRIDARMREMLRLMLAIVLVGVLLAGWVSARIARDVLARLDAARQMMQRQKEMAEALARTDPLTGLPNRRVFDAALQHELLRARRLGEQLALIVADIDHFKAINDTFGHAVGDEVLIDFARTLRATVREIDLVGRWGGEEFVILMPATTCEEAQTVAERLRETVAARRPMFFGQCLSYTASFGVVSHRPGESAAALFHRADKALYQAKGNGRNRVETG